MKPRRLTWNPKRLGTKTCTNGVPHETDVWLYLDGMKLDIVVQVNANGVVWGQTIHHVTIPNRRKK